jgi:hypothetical protein
MHDLMEDLDFWPSNIAFLVFMAWFIWHVVKTFGWEGLVVKFALLLDGVVVFGAIMLRKIPFTPWVASKPAGGIALWLVMGAACAAMIAYFYVVLSDRPTRWVIDKPRVKWTLYVAALMILARNGIREGWL